MTLDTQYTAFKQCIEEFANEFVGNKTYQKKLPATSKIIHDPLWGTIKLHPWEVALLDLPLFQRLRQIHQTSLVSYVFPGCSHTRFEHSLGVIQQTQKLIDAVNSQSPRTESQPFDHNLIHSLRLSALFHDCGHSCFSHISEELYAECDDMRALFSHFHRCSPHEALGYHILKSESVKNFVNHLQDHYKIKLDIDAAANWIVGKPTTPSSENLYETQVINGPFDADKLDYIFRDAHYSGIPIGLDLDRLWSSCGVHKCETSRMLTLHQASVAPLEQILFSKINLFAIVYQHPKVRAAEKMFQAAIELARENPKEFSFTASGRALDLKKATDFLWLTDEVFFSEALKREKDDKFHKIIHNIRYRRFLVRALTISRDTIKSTETSCLAGFGQLRKLNQKGAGTYEAKREIARSIIEKAGLTDEVNIHDVWIDLPSDPSFGESDRTFVRTNSGHHRKVSELFPITYWNDMYKNHKWRGHVFCPPEFQQKIYEASLSVLSEKFDIIFLSSAGEISHVPTPVVDEK